MTLTEFLLARIAEDEAIAQEASENDRRLVFDGTNLGGPPPVFLTKRGAPVVTVLPARVLAECEARKRIVEMHSSDGRGNSDWDGACDRPDPQGCPTLLELAQPHADHPQFNPAWVT